MQLAEAQENAVQWLLLSHNGFFTLRTRREFFKEILYKNIVIIAIQHSKMHFVDAPLAIFPILLSEIHWSPSGKFSYAY